MKILGKSYEISLFPTLSHGGKGKTNYPLQLLDMVAKDILPFASVPDGCKEANFMGFSQKMAF